jgi:hypothetical protein
MMGGRVKAPAHQRKELLLLMAIFSQSFFAFVGRNLMSFSLFSAGHGSLF